MARHGEPLEHPFPNTATAGRIRTSGALTMVGGAQLTVGAFLIDLGWFVDLPAIASLGNALAAAAGLGLIFLPFGLRASRLGGTGILATVGTASLAVGICLASIVDVPAILDPTDLEAGGAMGPIGLLLLSIGFLAWFVAIQRAGGLAGWRLYIFLVAALWFPLSFPTVQLPLFVIPNGRPSLILLAGVFGMLQLTMGLVVRERMAKIDPRQKHRTVLEDMPGGRPRRSESLTLATDRLVLRPIAADDVGALHRISNEPAVRRYLWDDEPVQEATIRDIISESGTMFADKGIGLFGVRRRGSENLIGFCGFVQLEGMEEPELAYELAQGAWGQGLATEMSRVCLRHAFEEAGLERVIAGADPENVASQRVIEKLGMSSTGRLNPKMPEASYFAVYRGEFLSGQGKEQ